MQVDTFSVWGWSNTGIDCPEMLQSLHLWKYSKTVWTWSWATSFIWPCLGSGVGQEDLKPHWFCTQEMQILEKGKHLLHQSPLIQLAWKQTAHLGGQEKWRFLWLRTTNMVFLISFLLRSGTLFPFSLCLGNTHTWKTSFLRRWCAIFNMFHFWSSITSLQLNCCYMVVTTEVVFLKERDL